MSRLRDGGRRACCGPAGARRSVRAAGRRRAVITSIARCWSPGTTRSRPFGAMVSVRSSGSGSCSAPSTRRAVYYLAAVAVAIGFKMNLFNIGVDGQYRLAAMLAAAVAGAAFMSSLPGFLRIAMTVDRRHGGRRRLGRRRRLPQGHPRGQRGDLHDHAERDRHVHHRLPADPAAARPCWRATTSARRRSPRAGSCRASRSRADDSAVLGLVFLAAIVGIVYALVLSRTAFGFDAQGHRAVRDRGRGQRHHGQEDDRLRDAALRRGRRAGRHAGAAQRLGRRPTR